MLDGALKENILTNKHEDICVSPDEKTLELTSPRSGPNSAGHTPYHLSPEETWASKDHSSFGVKMCLGSESQQVGLSKFSESGCPKSNQESISTSSKEKHSSFLSLSSFKDLMPDISPTVTTTHSMPAEVSSPQSTEVDESFSMSFEQVLPTVSESTNEDEISYSDGHHVSSDFKVGMSSSLKKPHTQRATHNGPDGCPSGPQGLLFDTTHDVDLCLVSPLFCSSISADGLLDSDEEAGVQLQTQNLNDGLNSYRGNHPLPKDPPPAPVKDLPPLPPQPGACMPDPVNGVKSATKGRKAAGVPQRLTSSSVFNTRHQNQSWKSGYFY